MWFRDDSRPYNEKCALDIVCLEVIHKVGRMKLSGKLNNVARKGQKCKPTAGPSSNEEPHVNLSG
jgi:hypothetical protein